MPHPDIHFHTVKPVHRHLSPHTIDPRCFQGFRDRGLQYVGFRPGAGVDLIHPEAGAAYAAQLIPIVIPRGMMRMECISDDFENPNYRSPYGTDMLDPRFSQLSFQTNLLDRIHGPIAAPSTQRFESSHFCEHETLPQEGDKKTILGEAEPLLLYGRTVNPCSIKLASSRYDTLNSAVRENIHEDTGYIAVLWDWHRGYAATRFRHVRRYLEKFFGGTDPVPMVGTVSPSCEIIWFAHSTDLQEREQYHEHVWNTDKDEVYGLHSPQRLKGLNMCVVVQMDGLSRSNQSVSAGEAESNALLFGDDLPEAEESVQTAYDSKALVALTAGSVQCYAFTPIAEDILSTTNFEGKARLIPVDIPGGARRVRDLLAPTEGAFGQDLILDTDRGGVSRLNILDRINFKDRYIERSRRPNDEYEPLPEGEEISYAEIKPFSAFAYPLVAGLDEGAYICIEWDWIEAYAITAEGSVPDNKKRTGDWIYQMLQTTEALRIVPMVTENRTIIWYPVVNDEAIRRSVHEKLTASNESTFFYLRGIYYLDKPQMYIAFDLSLEPVSLAASQE
ncbi:hypothetical protein GGR28_002395 [Lewinella aquimaris]|uniref:Uncharacterized protein n=1 Tax=Neolewinella aquimaris TaxID=1835722 RepID=A0A840ECR3_9BACT|nr:hypothetical protein [Neolewinella aquimaris]MBB4079768.1 hypothetical protein [Neolewinella aquimaris]